MHPTPEPIMPIQDIFLVFERWVCIHPLGFLLMALIAWGIWFRKDRY